MTNKQQKAVDRLKAVLDKEIAKYNADSTRVQYEIKRFEVDDNHYKVVFVVAEWGLVGDNGTAAFFLCREKVHFMIGERGGVTYIVDKVRGGITYLKFDWCFPGPMRHAAYITEKCEDKHMKWYRKHKMA